MDVALPLLDGDAFFGNQVTVEGVDVLVAENEAHDIVFADVDGLFHHPAGKLRLAHALTDAHDDEAVIH